MGLHADPRSAPEARRQVSATTIATCSATMASDPSLGEAPRGGSSSGPTGPRLPSLRECSNERHHADRDQCPSEEASCCWRRTTGELEHPLSLIESPIELEDRISSP